MNGRNIKLLIAYDGTGFCGWQKQGTGDRGQGTRDICPKTNRSCNTSKTAGSTLLSPVPCFPSQPVRTVQEEIENALHKIHKHPVSLTGAGRTDSGVHAIGQVANFFTDIESIPAQKITLALNSLLPRDVRILESSETAQNFHSRFSACARTYRYCFICRRPAFPHESRYNLQVWRCPKIETLNAYGRLLQGETDCSIFAGAGDSALAQGKSANRYVYSARFYIEGGALIFEIRANAFLRGMVRSVAGTFLHYEEKGTPPEELREIIASGERSLAGPTLPPQGLFLWKVDYGAMMINEGSLI